MAGGAGTRLWPLSRVAQPKQLLPLIADGDGPRRSLLQLADRRLEGVVPDAHRFICAAEAHRGAIVASLPGLTDDRYLGEPMGRDTVNAIGLGAAILARRDASATFAVLTADHLIEPQSEFVRALDAGFRLVEENPARLVTFAVTPTYPATGYGYVQRGAPIAGHDGACAVDRFVEKPDLATARGFLEAGGFGWNSGMFVFSAAGFLDCLSRHAPLSHAGLQRIAEAWDSPQRMTTLKTIYPTLPKISVDYAVMEPCSKDPSTPVCMVSMDVRWRDVGSWPSLGETLDADGNGNRSLGHALFHDSRNSLVVTDGGDHLVAVVGLDDVIVVRTADATLVCRADCAEQVKTVAGAVPESLR